jgi:hypothetical protein
MTSTASLELYFGNTDTPGLYRTVFRAPGHESPIVGVRGPLFHYPSLPFIWSTSCVALSLLFVSAVLQSATGEHAILPLLEGGASSPAGAIGKLMNKGVRSWLHDIFGSDSSGRSLLSRIILLGNARGRRHGPTTATLRSSYLSAKNISIFVDGVDISTNANSLAELKGKLLSEFTERKGSRLQKYTQEHTSLKTTCAA